MNDGTVEIDSLPVDNELYVVTKYGGVIKNHSFAVDIPLVKVTLNKIENNSIKTPSVSSLVGLPELSTVRIGTIWQNKVRQESYWKNYKHYEEKIPLSFNLKKNPAKSVRYIKRQNGNRSKLIPVELDNDKKTIDDDKYYGSSFTEFISESGIRYIVSSMELLMSTYVPRNKLIRNDLLLHDLDSVVDKYLKGYSCTDNKYTVHLDKLLEVETMAFLAHLSCNKKSRASISKIWGGLEGNSALNERHLQVLPYHPENISFSASGVWLDEHTFYIQRIYDPKAPSEKSYKFTGKRNADMLKEDSTEKSNDDESNDEQQQKYPLNQNQINEQTTIKHDRNPGSNAGVKYIVSETKPDNDELDFEVEEEIQVDDTQATSYKQEKKDVKTASSGKLSGTKDSEKVAMTKYVVDENPPRLDYALEIENSLNELISKGTIKSIKYIDDFAVEHDQLVYASFSQDHINLDGSKYWASGYIKGSGIGRSRAGYRKLLIIKIKIDGLKPFYIIEVIRKVESDKFKGIVFQTEGAVNQIMLEDIKRVIAINKGHFNKRKKPFPVRKSAQYKHKWGDMTKRFENVFESLKVKNIFE
ncbi:MAG: hypothetical protein M0Q24_01550 [Sulfurimonas sp.]|uniref:hypothetical protein n=1 Tax=Sulfurimonas sp. TaxID=2022749 RepID=UPI0025D2351D|nr:hypothetical protein [Sulfurimonas sp.]MCK9490748.1 hypothetical protein [Sulfurimonas sp.]